MPHPQSVCERIEYLQQCYDASGRPPGRILYRAAAGWWVKVGRKYVKLGRRWEEVEDRLRMGK